MNTKKQTILILAGIFLVATLSMVSASIEVNLYGGECHYFEYQEGKIINYTLEAESGNLTGINDSKISENEVEICASQSIMPDKLNLTLNNQDIQKEHVHHHHGGGGGTNVVYKDNETIKWKNNTEKIEYIPEGYVNASELENKSDQPKEPKDEGFNWLSALAWFVVGIAFCLSVIGVSKRKDDQERYASEKLNEEYEYNRHGKSK